MENTVGSLPRFEEDLALPAAATKAKTADTPSGADHVEGLCRTVLSSLDDDKALDVLRIDLGGRSSVADVMIIASGRSERHVSAIAEKLVSRLKDAGFGAPRVEGQQSCDWVLIDVGDVIVHLFRPEVRDFYKLEKMWAETDKPATPTGAADQKA